MVILICIAVGILVYLSVRFLNKRGKGNKVMPQGLEVNDSTGANIVTVTDRLTRILVTDTFAYADTFTRTYQFNEFLEHEPFVVCSSFNSYNALKDSVDVYLVGSNPSMPTKRNVWYQITWSVSGNTLTVTGKKSNFSITGTFGKASIRNGKISTPPFMLIIGVY